MVNIFKNPKWKQEYVIEINNKFEMLENLDDEDIIENDIIDSDIIDSDIIEKWENKTRIKKPNNS